MSREFIAEKLKELRKSSGLTADEVGQRVGKSGKTVNAWENNRGQPDAEILIMLCDIYGVDDILKEFREDKNNAYKQNFSLTDREKQLVIAYRSHPDAQAYVDKMLDLPEAVQEQEVKKLA